MEKNGFILFLCFFCSHHSNVQSPQGAVTEIYIFFFLRVRPVQVSICLSGLYSYSRNSDGFCLPTFIVATKAVKVYT